MVYCWLSVVVCLWVVVFVVVSWRLLIVVLRDFFSVVIFLDALCLIYGVWRSLFSARCW